MLLDMVFCLIVKEHLLFFLSFGCLDMGIFGFKSEQYFCTLDFCIIFNLRRSPRFVCPVYLRRSNIFFESHSATTNSCEKN